MKKGFTLIELMVTIAVIGVLAAIALPRFFNITKDAEVAQIQANRRNLQTAFDMCMVKEDKEPMDLFYDYTQVGAKGRYTLNKEFEKFEEKYVTGKIPSLPNIDRNKVGFAYENMLESKPEEEIEKHIRLGRAWIFSDKGRVYPVIKEEKYGIRFDKF